MAAEQNMAQTIMQMEIEATKEADMAIREADNQVNSARPIHTMPNSGHQVLRQPLFHWKAADKHQKQCNFEIEVKNIFMTDDYNILKSKRVPRILKWLGREGLRFMQTLNEEEQERCRTSMGLFKVLSD